MSILSYDPVDNHQVRLEMAQLLVAAPEGSGSARYFGAYFGSARKRDSGYGPVLRSD